MKLSLHTYLKKLREEGALSDYIEALQKNVQPLIEHGLPVVLTLGHLSHITDKHYWSILGIINRDIEPYRVFAIRKRKGGKRFICVPDQNLLCIQDWIHKNILCSPYALSQISSCATAYIPGHSHIVNAQRHVGAEWIVKVDITQFFEAISERQVYYVFKELGYRSQVAFCLTRLCTRVLPAHQDYRRLFKTKRWTIQKCWDHMNAPTMGHLPQGAPTSPMLANLVCIRLDRELLTLAQRDHLVYTRYADDLVFSGHFKIRREAEELIKKISTVIGKYGFLVNHRKTSIAKTGGRKIVTGLSVDGDELRLPKVYKDKLKQELYFLKTRGLSDHCRWIGQKNHLAYLLRLAGRIRYLSSIEPKVGEKYWADFSMLFPEFHSLESLIQEQDSKGYYR